MAYIGHYINLDRSPERRAAMEAQLARLDPAVRYRRFPAVDGNPHGFANSRLTEAELGCLVSHYLLLQMHLDGASHLHIVEDDVVFARRTALFLDQVIGSGMLDNFDILFVDTIVPMIPALCRWARSRYRSNIQWAADRTAASVKFELMAYHASTASYLVNRASVRAVCDILGEELESGNARPIDLLIRDKVAEGKLRARCLFPFVTSVRPGVFASSRAEANSTHRTVRAMELLRHSLFVECDMKATLDQANGDLATPESDWLDQLHSVIAGFMASDGFQAF